jgi:hypothetical protein
MNSSASGRSVHDRDLDGGAVGAPQHHRARDADRRGRRTRGVDDDVTEREGFATPGGRDDRQSTVAEPSGKPSGNCSAPTRSLLPTTAAMALAPLAAVSRSSANSTSGSMRRRRR